MLDTLPCTGSEGDKSIDRDSMLAERTLLQRLTGVVDIHAAVYVI